MEHDEDAINRVVRKTSQRSGYLSRHRGGERVSQGRSITGEGTAYAHGPEAGVAWSSEKASVVGTVSPTSLLPGPLLPASNSPAPDAHFLEVSGAAQLPLPGCLSPSPPHPRSAGPVPKAWAAQVHLSILRFPALS